MKTIGEYLKKTLKSLWKKDFKVTVLFWINNLSFSFKSSSHSERITLWEKILLESTNFLQLS